MEAQAQRPIPPDFMPVRRLLPRSALDVHGGDEDLVKAESTCAAG